MGESFLLVGGSSDIVLRLGHHLLDQGHAVTLLARDAERTTPLIDRGAALIQGDALNQETVQSAVEAASNHPGGMTGVAHLVGSIQLRPPHAMKVEDFESVLQTNLVSAFLTLKIAGKAMLKTKGGRMVFTSSVAGSYGLTNHEAIAAAKGGLEAMVRSAASTYAQRGIRVNAVAPGSMLPPPESSSFSMDLAIERSLLKKMGRPDDIAKAVIYFLENDFVTGTVLPVDGGRMLAS